MAQGDDGKLGVAPAPRISCYHFVVRAGCRAESLTKRGSGGQDKDSAVKQRGQGFKTTAGSQLGEWNFARQRRGNAKGRSLYETRLEQGIQVKLQQTKYYSREGLHKLYASTCYCWQPYALCPPPPLLRAGPSMGGGCPLGYLVLLSRVHQLSHVPSPDLLLLVPSARLAPALFPTHHCLYGTAGITRLLDSSPLPGLGSSPESPSQGTPVVPLSNP
ncbi:hypothetical protein EDB85DRAFT_1901103 [Lactarius pseudohatsudake]|nr:hypothetical protein EDB85DRAFT_1901103 [Lactarius pseudohatsudake]